MTAEQTDLFGRRGAPVPPIARSTDPWTSHAAARTIIRTGRRNSQHGQIFEAIARAEHDGVQPMTASEIGHASRLGQHVTARRLPELERMRVVERCEVRTCRVTGHKAATWRIRRP